MTTAESQLAPGTPPPGWYADPSGAQVLWWWDGSRYTQSTPMPPPPVVPAQATAPERTARERAAALAEALAAGRLPEELLGA